MDTGIFKSVKGEDFVQFLVKLGAPKADAEKLRGSVWRMNLSLADGDDPIHMELTCEQHPELNYTDNFAENKEKECKYHPFLLGQGGKAKVLIEGTGPDAYKGTGHTSSLGVVEWTEHYKKEGNLVTCKAKGESITELWTREESS